MRRRLLLPLIAGLAGPLTAQDIPADAGTLVIRHDGDIVGTETFEVRHDGPALTVQATARWGGGTVVVLAAYGPRRTTVRISGPAGEIARELPASSGMVLDDSVFAFLTLLPRMAPGEISVVWPRTGNRARGMLRDGGTQPTRVNGTATPLRLLELTLDGGTLRAWFDAAGHLVRAELPERRLEIVRDRSP